MLKNPTTALLGQPVFYNVEIEVESSCDTCDIIVHLRFVFELEVIFLGPHGYLSYYLEEHYPKMRTNYAVN